MSDAFALPRVPEAVIRPLCQAFCRQADCLLDLFEMTTQPRPPGECLQCFFKLRAVAPDHQADALQPLREWLERHVEITVEANATPAATFPVILSEADLETFCARAMHRVREDTTIVAPEVRLGLRYRGEAIPA